MGLIVVVPAPEVGVIARGHVLKRQVFDVPITEPEVEFAGVTLSLQRRWCRDLSEPVAPVR